jgi:NADPH:quinone reductase-like Zn-dependent oxidoreductase
MRAVQFDRHGEPGDVLQIRDIEPSPVPPGHARVRMLLSPINPSDLLKIRGVYGKLSGYPATPGFEGVGVVEEVHNTVARLVLGVKPGRKVVVLNQTSGNWQEQVVVPAMRLFPVPEGVTDEDAAGYFVNPATAWVMTREVLRVPEGAWLLQSAAGSAVGKMVIKLGKKLGFRTINLVRRAETAATLQRLGAEVVIDTSREHVVERVRATAGPEGVRFALDPVGGSTTSQVIECLGHGGRVLLYGSLDMSAAQLYPRHIIQHGITIEGFSLPTWAATKRPLQMLGLLKQLGRLIREGTLTAEVAQVFPLDQVHAAVQAAEVPGRQGKVLLRIGS